ncbi:MAG: hypothetical protein WB780_24645 [Candidatus Acidiferrales bacterium]
MIAGTSVDASAAAPRSEPQGVTVEIGGIPILLKSNDADFRAMIEQRYAGFLNPSAQPANEFRIHLYPPPAISPDEDAHVSRHDSIWRFQRGDFRAEWDAKSRRGHVHQSANPYAIDTVLRITHSLVLAAKSGFLVHAASAVRNGRAFLFAGASGAGKTTMASLAPKDALLLTDEISYVRRQEAGYIAFGTPFTGELAKSGENISAPVAALYLLAKGPKNSIEPVARTEAARALLSNILFFAEDPEFVELVFQSACEFVGLVPVFRLTFVPDARVWEMIV